MSAVKIGFTTQEYFFVLSDKKSFRPANVFFVRSRILFPVRRAREIRLYCGKDEEHMDATKYGVNA